MLWRSSRLLLFVLLSISVGSQTSSPPDPQTPTFKSKVQVVLVDVVVTDRNGRPVSGLHKDDFEIYESAGAFGTGDRQSIASFEEHRAARANVEASTVLPPNVFSNRPTVGSADNVDVLLLDALNTPSEDQHRVRREMIEYLKNIDPSHRLAIFTLGSRLQMVEGFTADPRQLLEAIRRKDWASLAFTPVHSEAEKVAVQTLLQAMADTRGTPVEAVQTLQDFLNEEVITEKVSRDSATLEALREICEYLGGFPGRKNIIWFSKSFPSGIFPSRDQFSDTLGLGGEYRDTVNLLAAAEIAVYPVAAEGLETQSMLQASQLSPTVVASSDVSVAQKALEGMNQSLDQNSTERVRNTGAADEIAANTGGKAFYNNNGLKEALTDAIEHGSRYYSLSYSPSDKRTLGRYRRITVKLRKKNLNVAYRRGYFEEGHAQAGKLAADSTDDPLRPLMRRGLPEATQMVFNLRVVRAKAQAAVADSPAGDNKQLRDPVARFGADFVIPLDSLDFEMTPDGVRHGNVELALVAYDRAGKPLNWLYRSIKTSLKPELYASVEKRGANFHQEIDVPVGEHYLRAGFYDLRSRKAGTVEIPLNKVVTAEVEAKTIESRRALATAGLNGLPMLPFSPETVAKINEGGNTGGASAPANPIEASGSVTKSGADSSSSATDELPVADLPGYCSTLAGSVEHAAALEKLCEFALSSTNKLPDVIVERKTKRRWKMGIGSYDQYHSDVVTAKVAYRDGHEYYEDIRIDGQPSNVTALLALGYWSTGEFALSLNTVFRPRSQPQFRFVKQQNLHSTPALVFDFQIKAENNKYYFLSSGKKVWFPEYHGRVWLKQSSFQLLRFERETADMPDQPILRTKTVTDYSMVPLGDGSAMLLPTRADVLTCAPPGLSPLDDCAQNAITFSKWQKFRAKTKVVLNPE